MKKVLRIIIAVVMIFVMFSSYSFAEIATKNKLEIVEKSAEELKLENEQGKVSKSIVDITDDEVTIELKLENVRDDIKKSNESEIMLVIDKSGSMEEETDTGEIRKTMMVNSAKTLVEKIFNSTTNVKVGIVTFSSEQNIKDIGTIEDADVKLPLSDEKQTILSKLEEIKNEKFLYATNIEAGIGKAESCYSSASNNRVMIILTDGIPNCDIHGNYCGRNGHGNIDEVKEYTKQALIGQQNKGVNIISMMTGVKDDDEQEVIEEVFGTEDNPTAGKFYNIKDTDLSNIVENEIFKDVMQIIQYPIDEVKMVDYFPDDIMNNFEFSYVDEQNFGTVSNSINPESKTITWDIGTLKGNEVAALKYKLKLKKLENGDLLNKVIATNDKVVLTYKDKDLKDYSVTLSSSPKIKLVKFEIEDDSVSPNILSQTGEYSVIIAGILIIAIVIIAYMRYKKMNFLNK